MTPLFAKPSIVAEERADGSLVVRSTQPLTDHPSTILASFRSWAEKDPDHVLATERRADGQRDALTYGGAASTARAVGEGLIQLGLGPERPLLLLSGNSIAHLSVLLGALTAGVPVSPISVAYSLQSRDHARIKEIAELTNPGAVFAEDADQFGDALAAVAGVPAIVCRSTQPSTISLDELIATNPGAAVDEAYARLESSSLAKILFTSGSTGSPKGVLTTHGMLAANQQQIRQAWPFLEAERPVVVDWLPWSHTFGGSHNVGLILVSGGTLHIDDGRPAPGLFDQSIQNLVDNPPTIYFNVPAGFAQLVPVLESDPEFAARFFSRLRLVFNAAAALPDGLRDRLHDVAVRTTGLPIPVTGSWGLTETAPAVTNAHYDFSDAQTIGVPLPGADLKLVPVADAYEIRVRGPMVTPGYLNRPDLTKTSFDEEGFYLTGDAVQLADPDDLDLGLLFRGRLAEDFKLTTGTFVRVGEVRTTLLSAIPVLADAVVAGENRDVVCALAWVQAAEVRKLLGRDAKATGDVIDDPELSAHIGRALGEHARYRGSAGRIERMVLMSRPAELDSGEITDKGYVNQRKVLANRAGLLDLLYPSHAPANEMASPVIVAEWLPPPPPPGTNARHPLGNSALEV